MSTLTHRQQAIYEFIVQQVHGRGRPPTLMEIADAFGLSSAAGVADHLKAIERKGFIQRHPGVSRGIEVRGIEGRTRPRVQSIPVIGDAPSNSGVDRASAERLALDARCAGERAVAFRARTGELDDHGVRQGDFLVVDSDAPTRPGDLVIGRQGRRVAILEIAADGRAATPVAGRIDPGADVRAYGPVVAILRTLSRTPPARRLVAGRTS